MENQAQGLAPIATPGAERALFCPVRELFFEITEEVLAQRILDEGGHHQARDAG